MSVLVIDDDTKAKVAAAIEHARAHPYRPADRKAPPGDDPAFVKHLESYRCVFTFTHMPDGGIYRHLSISVQRRRKFPHPFAAFTIAELYEFTGWDGVTADRPPDGWLVDVNEREGCIVLAQEIGSAEGAH